MFKYVMDVRRVAVVTIVSDYRCGDGGGEEIDDQRSHREEYGMAGTRRPE